MQYPLISEYIESVKDAENFATLTNLRPVLDDNGNPVMSSGNFAVVFKMTDGEKNYAVKCFTREQEGRNDNYKLICEELNKIDSPYILKIKYLEKEIFVDTNQSDETEFPVLAMDWVEGKTLSAFLSDIAKEYDNNHETWNEYKTKFNLFELRCMPTNFLWMTKWLLTQPFAHGDLKPDNIVVQENGTCVLIDYDGMFVPSMQGMPIACGGTQNFRHPYNQNQNLCKAVDNYAIAIIALSLQAFAIRPDLISKSSEFCIISESDVLSNKYLQRLTDQEELTSDKSFQDLLSVFMHVLSRNTLTSEWFEETIGEILVPSDLNIHDTEASKLDLESCWIDKYGVKYSLDGKKVLSHLKNLGNDYTIREGVLIICDGAFQHDSKSKITISESVNSIGRVAFANNDNLVSCNIPSSVVHICNNNPWGGCFNIKNMTVQSPHFVIEDGILYSSDFTIAYGLIYWHQRIKINPKTYEIAANAFWSSWYEGGHPITEVDLENVKIIGKHAFNSCSFADFFHKNSLEKIGDGAFFSCKKLRAIDVKDVSEIPDSAFFQCESLTSVVIGHKVARIGSSAFSDCSKIGTITISEVTEFISNAAFWGCNSLKNIIVDKENQNFASVDGVLFNKNLTTLITYPAGRTQEIYEIPSSVRNISDCAFYDNKFLKHISSKFSIVSLGESAFEEHVCLNELDLSWNADKKSLWNYGHSLIESEKSSNTNSIKKGLDYVKQAASQECAEAQYFLSECYKEGKYNLSQDNDKRMYWLKRAAENGDITAVDNLAQCYEKGLGVCKDLKMAKVLIKNYINKYGYDYCFKDDLQRIQRLIDEENNNKFDSTPLTFTVNDVSFEMIPVEGGTFTMGATTEQGGEACEREKPAHKVTLSNYAIGKFEVTQELWTAVMGNNPSKFRGDNCPVEGVSWNDCQEFIKKLNGLIGKNFRLPTEAEWEYAARGGKKSKGYKYSGSNNIDEVAWNYDNSKKQTHSVGIKKPNELGIYDMSGNVYEWCNDWYGGYTSTPADNPIGPSSGGDRVYRGGTWNSDAGGCRVSYRFRDDPVIWDFNLGFRLVLPQ